MVLNWGSRVVWVPRGLMEVSRDSFCDKYATGIQSVEAKEAVVHPTMHSRLQMSISIKVEMPV
jgi:hypothetical protein